MLRVSARAVLNKVYCMQSKTLGPPSHACRDGYGCKNAQIFEVWRVVGQAMQVAATAILR